MGYCRIALRGNALRLAPMEALDTMPHVLTSMTAQLGMSIYMARALWRLRM